MFIFTFAVCFVLKFERVSRSEDLNRRPTGLDCLVTSSQLPATRECDPQPVSEWLLEIDHLKMVINAVAKPPCDCFGCQQVAEITCSFHGKHKLVWKYLDFPHQALLKLEKWKVIGNVSL